MGALGMGKEGGPARGGRRPGLGTLEALAFGRDTHEASPRRTTVLWLIEEALARVAVARCCGRGS